MTDTINHADTFKTAFLAFLGESTTDTVEKRDGSSAVIDYNAIPADLLITFLSDGCMEYVRDSASAALSNAYTIAHPDNKLEGDKLKSARIKWVGTDDNVFKVRDESSAIMAATIGRMEAGERRKSSAAMFRFTSLDDAIYDAAVSVRGVKGFESVAKAWTNSKGTTTGERKTTILAAVVDDLPDALRTAVVTMAEAHITSMKALADAGLSIES